MATVVVACTVTTKNSCSTHRNMHNELDKVLFLTVYTYVPTMYMYKDLT